MDGMQALERAVVGRTNAAVTQPVTKKARTEESSDAELRPAAGESNQIAEEKEAEAKADKAEKKNK
mgnify:CR=1 FL=1